MYLQVVVHFQVHVSARSEMTLRAAKSGSKVVLYTTNTSLCRIFQCKTRKCYNFGKFFDQRAKNFDLKNKIFDKILT